MTGLGLGDLREANTARLHRWHGPNTEQWTIADWSNAMCGEAGEAANFAKKVRRVDTRTDGRLFRDGVIRPGFRDDHVMEERSLHVHAMGFELADTVIYADLVAAHEGLDLSDYIVRKFNFISEREGFPDRLHLP